LRRKKGDARAPVRGRIGERRLSFPVAAIEQWGPFYPERGGVTLQTSRKILVARQNNEIRRMLPFPAEGRERGLIGLELEGTSTRGDPRGKKKKGALLTAEKLTVEGRGQNLWTHR